MVGVMSTGAGTQAALRDLAPRQFIVGFWVGPPSEQTTPERYKEIAQAGFNLVMPPCPPPPRGEVVELNKRILDLCRDNGMQAVVEDPRVVGARPDSPDFERNLDGVVSDYGSHPALFGYYVMDEPSIHEFPRLAAISRYLLSRDPKHVPIVNLLPIVATETHLGAPFTMDAAQYPAAARAYEDHVAQFVSTVRPPLLSYDEYDLFVGGGMRGMYFANLEIIRQAALEHALPFSNTVLISAHSHPHGVYRSPSIDDLRFLVYTTLAYGARGLMYFGYWSWPPFVGIMSLDGTRTEYYDRVSQLNREVRTLAPILCELRSAAVYHVGDIPRGARALPADDLIQSVHGADTLLGLFDDAKGLQYVMLVNKDLSQGRRISIVFRKPVELIEFSRLTGLSRSRGCGSRFEFDFEAGAGRLFRYDSADHVSGRSLREPQAPPTTTGRRPE